MAERLNNVLVRQQEQQKQLQQLAQEWADCQRLAEELNLKQQKIKMVLDSLQTCPLHNKKYEFISIAPVESPFTSFYQCQDCVDGLPQSEGQFLKIFDILEDGQDTIFPNYPFIHNQDLIRQIKTPAIHRKFDLKWSTISKKYFHRLRSDLCDNVDQIEDSIQEHIQSIEKISENILDEYYQCSAKEQLKQVILDGLFEGQGGMEKKIKAIAANAIKDSCQKEDLLQKWTQNLKQKESMLDLKDSNTVKIMVMHCLSLIKVHKEGQTEKKNVKEYVKLPDEEGDSIEIIQLMLKAVKKELKKAQRPSAEFKKRVKYEIDMFRSKMNEYLERDGVVKANNLEKKERAVEVKKEQEETRLKKSMDELCAEIEREQNKGLEKNAENVEQILGKEQLKIEEYVDRQEEIKDTEQQERPKKEGLREKLRKNDGIVESEEDMEIENDNEELTEKKELTEEENDEKELTEEEMLQLAIEESQNEKMLKMELEEKMKIIKTKKIIKNRNQPHQGKQMRQQKQLGKRINQNESR